MRGTLYIGMGLAAVVGYAGCGGSQPPAAETSASPPEPTVAEEAPAQAEPTEPAPEAANGEPGPEKEKPDVPPQGASVDRIMQAHFKDALLIREAIIRGRAEDAADPAYVIANIQELDKLPKGWNRYVEQMQETARRINNSTSASAAAAAVADLGVSCGMCHQQLGGPKPSAEPAPAAGTTVESRMQRHVWATERLWEGLAVPSGKSWEAGSKALSAEPFPKELLDKGGVDVRSAAADFTKLVAKAPAKKTVDARAALYAELLVTCGTCHQAIANKD